MIFTIFDGKVVKKGSKPAVLYNSGLCTVPHSIDNANIKEVQQPLDQTKHPPRKIAAAITGCGVTVHTDCGAQGGPEPYLAPIKIYS